MAEYIALEQNVGLGNPIIFESSIPCNKGCVLHNENTGVFILRGNTTNCFSRYQITFNGNVAVPTGGAISPIGVAVSENGEARPYSIAVTTPTVVEAYENVTSTAIVTVPRGESFFVSVRYVDATTDDAATTPTPTIAVRNGNLTITRIA